MMIIEDDEYSGAVEARRYDAVSSESDVISMWRNL